MGVFKKMELKDVYKRQRLERPFRLGAAALREAKSHSAESSAS